MGSLGYRERTVAVKDIFFLFKWVAPIDNGMIDLGKWQEVNEYVNELELTKRENNGFH